MCSRGRCESMQGIESRVGKSPCCKGSHPTRLEPVCCRQTMGYSGYLTWSIRCSRPRKSGSGRMGSSVFGCEVFPQPTSFPGKTGEHRTFRKFERNEDVARIWFVTH